jgi:hypothetical protein
MARRINLDTAKTGEFLTIRRVQKMHFFFALDLPVTGRCKMFMLGWNGDHEDADKRIFEKNRFTR